MKALGLIIAATAARERLMRMLIARGFRGCHDLDVRDAQRASEQAAGALAMYRFMVSQ